MGSEFEVDPSRLVDYNIRSSSEPKLLTSLTYF